MGTRSTGNTGGEDTGRMGAASDRPRDKYAWTVTVGSKGQIVIPKEAREVFGIEPGDHLLILADAQQGMAIPPKSSMDAYFEQVFG